MQPSFTVSCAILVLALLLPNHIKAVNCPDGWTADPSSVSYCYKAYKERRAYLDAEAQCKADGGSNGNLASIHNAFENQFLLSFVLENGIEFNPGIGFVWIGLSNLHSSVLTDYKWIDGSALTYTHWFVGDQIHQAHPEVDSCVGFFVSDLPNFSAYAATWTAGPTGACNQTWPFVCQVSLV
uniref:C-type lectin domain-containing protein n=1 Tax=Plectus sambesii TaxID=2011161 RepID=A0A914VTX7_9BILA